MTRTVVLLINEPGAKGDSRVRNGFTIPNTQGIIVILHACGYVFSQGRKLAVYLMVILICFQNKNSEHSIFGL